MGLVTVGLLLLATVFFAYRAFDTGVTLTYYEVEMEDLRDSRKILARIAVVLANAPSRSETEVQLVIEEEFGDRLIKREGDTLFVDQVGLRFERGKLAEIRFMDDPLPAPIRPDPG
jgi:hypothetical protein